MDRFCAVIPAYNEEGRIGAVVAGALRHVSAVVVVDDGSRDATAAEARAGGAVVIEHRENQGKGAALRDGLRYAAENGFAAAVTLDADGQHDTREIPRFIEEYQATGADIVLGSRMKNRKGMPFVRLATNVVTSAIISRIAGRRITDSQSGFRLVKCSTAALLPVETSRFDMESEMLVMAARAGLAIREVPVSTIYGEEKSKINPLADTCRFVRLAMRLVFRRN